MTTSITAEIEEAARSTGLKGVVLLEKTENSDLLPLTKPSEAEFFERVFESAGPFWRTYAELGLGSQPHGRYMSIIGGRMYFSRNITERAIHSIGMRKEYSIADGRIVRKRKLNLDNLLLLLSAPADTLKHASATIVTAFKINESLKEFVSFSDSAKREWASFDVSLKGKDPIDVAERSLEKALECMRFSFLASIAYSLRVKLADSPAWSRCELEDLINSQKGKQTTTKEDFGFYSTNPYAISEKRFAEDPSGLSEIVNSPAPKNRYIRMRENCKFLAARYLAMRRFAYLKIGRESGLGDLVFFLKTAELKDAKSKKALAEERKRLFLEQQKLKLPPQFVVVDGKLLGEVEKINEIYGQSVAGQSKVSGRAVFVNSRADFSKKLDGAVLVSKSLIPDLVEVYDKIIGVVSESGGALAHAAVIAREMNLTCVVQAKGIEAIKEGDLIEVDGKTGEIKLQR